ncbi:TPA: hypothetical protein ACH3X1_000870 [Trebouxia sp. C0004]
MHSTKRRHRGAENTHGICKVLPFMSQARQIISLEKDYPSVRKDDISGVDRFLAVIGPAIQCKVRWYTIASPCSHLAFCSLTVAATEFNKVPASVSAPASITLFLMNQWQIQQAPYHLSTDWGGSI